MKEPNKGGGFWNNLRQGGMPSAIASIRGGESAQQTAQQMAFIRSLMREKRRPEVLHTPLSELETVIFDLETTGFSHQHGDEIMSFGAIRVVGEEIKEEECFYTLVKCQTAIPENITRLTGITEEMTAAAPSLIDGLHNFMAFVGQRVLVAHGSAHDKSFLNAALWKTSKVQLTHRVLDTMMLARWLEPQRSNYTLDELLAVHNIPIQGRHHALEDARMTAQLWVTYLREIANKRQVDTLGDLYAYLSRA
ncbi:MULTISPECIES: exonuclease domain-containing protein [unclassified Paenibacillus]|uniref:exonuclease domain-containing protein n=1 Tax=unclassified Paenibacillus TaxID=185978 RepID=UPI002404A137|nr:MULTISPECIES: exonuclease domain-containing protein [unclassified Paenibacillus]MDF9842674.1 DNA polymerase-3 subunit epsilon [Paenibacillus sp. PastF-2]MDF9849119.1 DNA polymerase-3 subunit epsilon [Paenibacillus sp. PastM-2]MDF9855835.1 DNA polymerase-3 subunit epsilon [Paenibacillus sp. PastF-1]MDH6480961.1 DNA polymerase-3 subunit epsilon [Paenibacillus sp. PastH-2]MDH6508526.1 DNA polymerase-3 subunit epsilon [Paenibacillus sp. PastM-3]